jgi:FkbM family methyltransferase
MATLRDDTIYDVGLHKGEDTAFYLRKGYRVVAIEASSELVERASQRFADAVASGRLHLIHGAVAPAAAGDKIIFYQNPGQPVWGTTKAEWAGRNAQLGFPSHQTVVDRIDMADVYRCHGVPFYLKVDVEGVDRLVLEELKSFPERPQYVSLESEKVDFSELKAEMELLRSLGYTKFKVVQQQTIPGTSITTHSRDGHPFEHEFDAHASGPFGDDLPEPWLNHDQALDEYKAVFRRYRHFGDSSLIRKIPVKARRILTKLYRIGTGDRAPLPGWFDTHASL